MAKLVVVGWWQWLLQGGTGGGKQWLKRGGCRGFKKERRKRDVCVFVFAWLGMNLGLLG